MQIEHSSSSTWVGVKVRVRVRARARARARARQRFVLTTHEGNEIWVQPSGTIVCRHGNSQKTLNKLNTNKTARFRSASIVKCNCRSLSIPRRVGSVFVQKKCLIKA